jgi:hypothetical protein
MKKACAHAVAWLAIAAGCVIVGTAPVAAQDAATTQLQQDVLELKRVNQLMERRIESLEAQLSGQGGTVPMGSAGAGGLRPGAPGVAASPATLRWMDNAEWERIKPGMPEMEVIRILGVPNSLRDADQGRKVIFYALEIGTARFLSGSVTLADHRVVEVQKPSLK